MSAEDGAAPAKRLDHDAFADRFTQAAGLLWVVAYGLLGDRQLAEDVVQEAAIIGLDKAGTFTPGTSFNAWMCQIVRNVARNRQRWEQRRQAEGLEGLPGEAVARQHGTPVNETGGLTDGQEAFDDRVVAALTEVSETARACLLLRTVHGLPYAEISGLLDIPEGTAMSHVHRARKLMRKLLTAEPATGGNPT